MLRSLVSIFFITLFTASMALPSVVLLADDSIDISFLYDWSEEEEEKGSEKNKEFEIIAESISILSDEFMTIESEENLAYRFKKYPKPHLNLIFPPPERSI